MKILVCIKQVMESETVVEIDESGRWYRPVHPPRFQMNSFDEFAVEAAMILKVNHPGCVVDALTVGPERADAVLERAMGMGVDHGIRVVDQDNGYCEPRRIAVRIARFAAERIYDLILTGVMADDDMQGMVGPMIAAFLDWPAATAVMSIETKPANGRVMVEREIEGGCREELELSLPAVLTIQSGINRPRYPTLSNLLKAKKKKPETIAGGTSSDEKATDEITSIGHPVRLRAGIVLEGSSVMKAKELCRILKERALL
jgi:electron transfer flavoprotein beta subunit